jgi:hypothetical protein
MSATILVLMLPLFLLAGCATDRPAKRESAPERTVFDSPDVDSLH